MAFGAPGICIAAPSKVAHWLVYFPLKVPFAKLKWLCPFKDDMGDRGYPCPTLVLSIIQSSSTTLYNMLKEHSSWQWKVKQNRYTKGDKTSLTCNTLKPGWNQERNLE